MFLRNNKLEWNLQLILLVKVWHLVREGLPTYGHITSIMLPKLAGGKGLTIWHSDEFV
jgi:hypothetical protein